MSDEASIKAIQQRMQEVRHELTHEVDELVASARDMTDWRNYVRAYPWACAAAAAAVGYLLVPRGQRRVRLDESELASIAKQANVHLATGEPVRRTHWQGAVTKAVATAVMRGVLGYVGHRLTKPSPATEEESSEPF
jgi:hypothetical protein